MTIDELVSHINLKAIPPDDTVIEAHESQFGGKFPIDYRQFITQCNGGTIEDSITDHENDIVLDWILGIRDDDYLSISEHLVDLEPDIPHGVVPIIADPFGNYICIDLRTERHGHIYFYDHEDITLKVVSFSFKDFVARLNKN